MTLAGLKQVAVRKQSKIRFSLPGGLECVITEHGIAQVPGLSRAPGFNLEDAARSAPSFTVEPVAVGGKKPAPPQRITPAELAALAGNSSAAHPDEHED